MDRPAGRDDRDERAAIEARLGALGYGPERVAIAAGAAMPAGTRWAVTVHDPGGAGLRHFLSATHYSTNAFFRHQLGPRFTQAQLGQTLYPNFAAARNERRA